jgi:hypothetical protein
LAEIERVVVSRCIKKERRKERKSGEETSLCSRGKRWGMENGNTINL